MKCKSTTELLTQYLLGDLPPNVSDEIRLHLQDCDGCRAEAADIESTLELLSDALATTQENAPANLESAHYAKIYAAGVLQPEEKETRKPIIIHVGDWFTTYHHQLAAAAAMIFLGAVFLSMSVVQFGGRSKDARRRISKFRPQMQPQIEVSIMEPEPIEELEKIEEIDLEDRKYAHGTPTQPSPSASFSPQPSEFDAVAMTESPVIMKGIYGSRSPSAGVTIKGYGGNVADAPAPSAAMEETKKDGYYRYLPKFEETAAVDDDPDAAMDDNFHGGDDIDVSSDFDGEGLNDSDEFVALGYSITTTAGAPNVWEAKEKARISPDEDRRSSGKDFFMTDQNGRRPKRGASYSRSIKSKKPQKQELAEPQAMLQDAMQEVPTDLYMFADLKVANGSVEEVEPESQSKSRRREKRFVKGKRISVSRKDANREMDMSEPMKEAEEQVPGLEGGWLEDKEEMPQEGMALGALVTESEDLISDLLEAAPSSFPSTSVAGNVKPEHKEQDGKSNLGRAGMSLGEFAAGSGTIVGDGERRAADPIQAGHNLRENRKAIDGRKGDKGRGKQSGAQNERWNSTPNDVNNLMKTVKSLVDASYVMEVKPTSGEIDKGYTIKRGDTLSAIAAKHNISVKELADANKIANADQIRVGGKLMLPAAPEDEKLPPTPPRSVSSAEVSKEIGDGEIVAGINVKPVEKRVKVGAKPKPKAQKPKSTKEELSGPKFEAVGVNPFVNTKDNAFSTFAIDVDTASYTLARNYMQKGFLPPAESVRTEEFVNFFDYDYAPAKKGMFKIYTECAPSKFGHGLHMLKIGVKGKAIGRQEKKNAILTFAIDSSGSMNQMDRIGLVRKSFELLLEELDPADEIAIVQFGSKAHLVLEHTPAFEKEKILAAIKGLQISGSTNLEEAMLLAYRTAAKEFKPGGSNRVIVMSDGAANIGEGAADKILSKIEQYSKQGIFCSIFGYGIGTYNDEMLETLANKGNGTYSFIDSEDEARRVFVDELSATLHTIASDVKIQVEFDLGAVKRYRQLGYENRQLTKKQFRDNTVDAGEVGSGQSVTALYETELSSRPELYGRKLPRMAIVRVRYRRVDTGAVEEIEKVVYLKNIANSFEKTSPKFKLACGVAEFAEILRGSQHAQGSEYNDAAAVIRPVALEFNMDQRIRELRGMLENAGGMSRGDSN